MFPKLGRRLRRAVLILHIIAIGAWLGMDVVMGILVLTAMSTGSAQTAALCYQALELFAAWPLFAASLASLVTGVVLGLGTKFGLVRYWWVVVKLVLNVVLTGLIVFLLRPGLGEAALYGRQLAVGQPTVAAPDSMPFPPIVSLIALLVAMVLSVYKPWGRVRAR